MDTQVQRKDMGESEPQMTTNWPALANVPKVQLKVKKAHPDAKLPEYATDGSACFDLHAVDSITIEPGRYGHVSVGLAFEIPPGWEMQVRSRSGHAFRSGVTAFPGTIDSDYRGVVRVMLINGGNEPFSVSPGDRIAQAAVVRAYRAQLVEAEELSETERGEGGFGSTGK